MLNNKFLEAIFRSIAMTNQTRFYLSQIQSNLVDVFICSVHSNSLIRADACSTAPVHTLFHSTYH